MHSYLITGGSQEDRIKKEHELCGEWNVQEHDIIRLSLEEQKQSIGIEQIRLLTRSLSLSPQSSDVTVGIIDEAEKLTPEAQNALLKTLEEPPPRARIILETENKTLLLPTIVSRCQIIHITTAKLVSLQEKETVLRTFFTFQGKKPGEIVQLVTHLLEDKEHGAHFLDTLLFLFHEQLTSGQPKPPSDGLNSWSRERQIYSIRQILRAQKLLSSHIQTSLVFDHFFLTIMLDKQ